MLAAWCQNHDTDIGRCVILLICK